MFILRFRPNTYRLLWNADSKSYVSTNIGGRFFCETPTNERGYSTTDINQAKVFNTKESGISSMYFADCEPVEISITIK